MMSQPLPSSKRPNTRKALALWLYSCAFMVFAMAIIGAITRLTESGLSIVEWRPIMGALPPLNETEWTRLYELYKDSPEFDKNHFWMSIEDFKQIFFWEWLHRLWGRLIGLVFAGPLMFFLITKRVPKGWALKLIGLFLLGGAQGLMGWIMVQSGLVDRPSVSHFRLAAHLSLAVLIFGLLIWAGRAINNPSINAPDKNNTATGQLDRYGLMCLGLLSITIIWGAFVAGLDAGKIYNYFPMMSPGHWLPQELHFDPLNNHGWVQFTHRVFALISSLFIGYYAYTRKAFAVGGALLFQIGLGIATILSAAAIPIAATHQAGAFILLAALVIALYANKAQNVTQ
jgi:cytochrome c oxidase assembly protein subunit 15